MALILQDRQRGSAEAISVPAPDPFVVRHRSYSDRLGRPIGKFAMLQWLINSDGRSGDPPNSQVARLPISRHSTDKVLLETLSVEELTAVESKIL